jgi:rhamnulokinase
MLAGVERSTADTSEWARSRNFTNEAGALDGFRFLRNVTGFWLLEQCRIQWDHEPIETLIAAAESVDDDDELPVVDVDHDDLRAPDDMLTAYTSLAGLPHNADPGLVTRSIIESVAVRSADVVSQLGDVATFDDIVLFGGAARMKLLGKRLAGLTGLSVATGSAEAAALGNAIVQGVAIGRYASIDEANNQM